MAISSRSREILWLCVEEYIRTGEPVGSGAVAAAMGHAVSSATVRAEMAELTGLGLVQQPHTSAGRVPTLPAFRLYIDALTAREAHRRDALPRASGRRIDDALVGYAGDPDRLIQEAAQLLADATGCAAVVTPPADEARRLTVQSVRLLPLPGEGRGALLAVMLAASGGVVRSRVCRLSAQVPPPVLETLERLLQREVVGRPPSVLTASYLQRLLPAMAQALGGEWTLTLACVPDAVRELAGQLGEAELRLTGELNLLRHPDFAWERAQALMDFLSARERLNAVLEETVRRREADLADHLRVVFGSEVSGSPEGTSFVLTRYALREESAAAQPWGGAVGVIGPLRMDYAHTIALTRHVAATLGRLMAQLWDN